MINPGSPHAVEFIGFQMIFSVKKKTPLTPTKKKTVQR